MWFFCLLFFSGNLVSQGPTHWYHTVVPYATYFLCLLLPGYPTIQRAQYPFAAPGAAAAAAGSDQHLPATYTPSAAAGVTPSSVAFHSDPSGGVYGGTTSPMYATHVPHAQQMAQYAPTTSQSVVSAAYTRWKSLLPQSFTLNCSYHSSTMLLSVRPWFSPRAKCHFAGFGGICGVSYYCLLICYYFMLCVVITVIVDYYHYYCYFDFLLFLFVLIFYYNMRLIECWYR